MRFTTASFIRSIDFRSVLAHTFVPRLWNVMHAYVV